MHFLHGTKYPKTQTQMKINVTRERGKRYHSSIQEEENRNDKGINRNYNNKKKAERLQEEKTKTLNRRDKNRNKIMKWRVKRG